LLRNKKNKTIQDWKNPKSALKLKKLEIIEDNGIRLNFIALVSSPVFDGDEEFYFIFFYPKVMKKSGHPIA